MSNNIMGYSFKETAYGIVKPNPIILNLSLTLRCEADAQRNELTARTSYLVSVGTDSYTYKEKITNIGHIGLA